MVQQPVEFDCTRKPKIKRDCIEPVSRHEDGLAHAWKRANRRGLRSQRLPIEKARTAVPACYSVTSAAN
jgi:hypothetical protein